LSFLRSIKIPMQTAPSIKSGSLVWWMFLNTLVIVSKKPDDEIFNPSKLFNWDVIIITDVAEVKPTVTGIEIKSINTPIR
jgi:hypothetical protein